MKPINILNRLNESISFDDCPADIPDDFEPVECWVGEGNVGVYKYLYKKDKDIYLKYYSTDEFSIGSENNWRECYQIANSSRSSAAKRKEKEIDAVWDKYMYNLNDYSDYSTDEIIDMCDNLSNLYHEFLEVYGRKGK